MTTARRIRTWALTASRSCSGWRLRAVGADRTDVRYAMSEAERADVGTAARKLQFGRRGPELVRVIEERRQTLVPDSCAACRTRRSVLGIAARA